MDIQICFHTDSKDVLYMKKLNLKKFSEKNLQSTIIYSC